MAEIARRLNRSPNTVDNVLLKTPNYRVQEKRGRPRKLSPKLIRALRRKYRSGKYSTRKLRNVLVWIVQYVEFNNYSVPTLD